MITKNILSLQQAKSLIFMNYVYKKVWITGASSGMGEAMAKEFNALGAKVIISSRRENELIRVKNACKFPEKVFIKVLDLEDYLSLEQKANEVIFEYGTIDILVNNGGISQRAKVEQEDFAIIEKLMKINFFSAAMLSKVCLKGMIEQKFGQIVCMSSLAGKFGIPLRSGYAASKHALHGFFETLRAENYQNNIRVLMVTPGYVNTNVAINALTANVNSTGQNDLGEEQGMAPEKVAKQIINAINKNKLEIAPGGLGTFGIKLHKFFPRLFSKIIRKKQ